MNLSQWKEKEKGLYSSIVNLEQAFGKDQEWIDAEFRRQVKDIRAWEIRMDSIGVFLEEEDGFVFDLSASMSSQEFYGVYCDWCRREKVVPQGLRALSWRLKHSEICYPVRGIILNRNGRRCRGFAGVRAVTPDTDNVVYFENTQIAVSNVSN